MPTMSEICTEESGSRLTSNDLSPERKIVDGMNILAVVLHSDEELAGDIWIYDPV
jgi:hypothetical protein